MSDRDHSDDSYGPDDAGDHDWVRRVLAEAGTRPEPTPDWVGHRVEETLASLRDERAVDAGDPTGAVVEMTPRRHRRWATGLLVAAALAVGGYSLGATGLLGDAGSGSADSVTAGEAAGGADGDAAPADPGGVAALSSDSLRVDARVLAQDLRAGRTSSDDELAALPEPQAAQDSRVQQGGDPEKVRRDYSGDPLDEAQAEAQGDTSGSATKQQGRRETLDLCVPPPRSVPGTRRPVSLDSAPATAVLRRLDDGRVRVQVWSCESPRRLAQVTVRP